MVSNTFATTASAKAIGLSRNDINNSLLALLTNFYGPSVPTSTNLTLEGVATNPQEGTLWRSTSRRTLYIYDSTATKGGGGLGNWTRVGLGAQVFDTTPSLDSLSLIEPGELFVSLETSNSRLFMKLANGNSSAAYRDVSIPTSNSITSAMIQPEAVTNTKIQLSSVTPDRLNAAANTAEVTAGTETLKYVTPAGLQGKIDTLFSLVKAYDIPFNAGFLSNYHGANLSVQTYGEVILGRNVTFLGEYGWLGNVATGANVIVDVLKNNTSIYTTPPQFNVSTNILANGVLASTTGSAGERLTFKVTQIGSTLPGQLLEFILVGAVR